MATWNIDPDHSVGSFSIRHMMVAFVHGQMNGVSGTVCFDPEDMSGLTVELEIDVDSIITGIGKRDDHLKSVDFFDIEKYSKITFQSTEAERTGFHSCNITGVIGIHGTNKTISLKADISGPVKSPFGGTALGLTATCVLNREDFGMTWNEPMEKGGFMVGREVEVEVNLEADLAEDRR